MIKDDFSKQSINRIYLSMYKMVKQLPFSNHHWLEQFMVNMVKSLLDDHKNDIQFTTKKPVDICKTFLNFLDQEGGYLGAYRLEESGDNLLISIKRENCVYREFCFRSHEEDLPFFCLRLGALQALLHILLGENYSNSVEIGEHVCNGILFPSTQLTEEIVTREGIELKLAGRRAILLPQETFASLMMAFKEHAPHALKHVLYEAGYVSGLNMASKASGLYSNLEERLQFLQEHIRNTGVGMLELVSIDLSSTTVRLRCYDSFQVAITKEYGNLYRSPQVICDLLRGFFAGYLSVLFEKEIICEEMSCQSVGGNFCEFVALPIPRISGM
ncbi:MAG: V4R domain protein [Pelotomaculum sp. PtaB.Bin104]|nr:MAG: V4R domain protein [Pelotomaculum sp. PtaB.Bin104]